MKHLFTLVCFLFCAASYAQSVPSLAEREVQLAANQSLPLADQITFEIVASNSEEVARELNKLSGITANAVQGDALTISMLLAQPTLGGGGHKKYLNNSFVIDIDESVVIEFVSNFKEKFSAPWRLENFKHHVSNYINEPTYINGFLIASRVAAQRSGDCTEYAVLLTALARSLGLPSRVVVGTVVLEEEAKVSAFGHAWSEVWLNDQWNIVDAALYNSTARQHFYLPAGELENEGPGYALSLFSTVSRLPSSINDLRDF